MHERLVAWVEDIKLDALAKDDFRPGKATGDAHSAVSLQETN